MAQYNGTCMKLIADLHIHSHFSIATSKQLVPEHLDLWARIKGINIVGTGDFTHPSWVDELEEKLEPAEEGLYRLRDEYSLSREWGLPPGFGDPVRFILSAEISSIYKKWKKVRKVHNVILAPDFKTVRRIQAGLARRKFNITSDGRPILGLDSRDLLELILDISDRTFFIPAHIWTPWFSALGARSGFDTIEECYQDLSPHIHAVETGLSSDPAMNWMCGFLDKYTLVSNSDAHSPEKLGREANILDAELSYPSITGAVASGAEKDFLGTIEFFPQEGKYHYDGHRKCGICWDPLDNLRNGGICTVCGKPVTQGVMSRIAQLSDRSDILERAVRAPFYSITPLKEILSEIMGVGPNSRKVASVYRRIITSIGAEFGILLDNDIKEIEDAGVPQLAEAIRRMRAGEVHIREGYDGEFGVIRMFADGEIARSGGSLSLFSDGDKRNYIQPEPKLLRFSLGDYRELASVMGTENQAVAEPEPRFESQGSLFQPSSGLASIPGMESIPEREIAPGKEAAEDFAFNIEQEKAVNHGPGPSMVIAGPGTGKTHVLTGRILQLVKRDGAAPESILAVTFTNKAAGEMSRRISRALKDYEGNPSVVTFHALGYMIVTRNLPECGRREGASLIDQEDQESILAEIFDCSGKQAKKIRERISRVKQGSAGNSDADDVEIRAMTGSYDSWLKENNLFDLDDLITEALRLLEADDEVCSYWRDRFGRVLVDEFQDINLAQYRLLRVLCPDPESSICVIGDPDQAIYGFRGSDARFMGRFLEDYPSAGVYPLKKSYRCTDTILQASSGVLRPDNQEEDRLVGLIRGDRLKISAHSTDRSEAEFVARTIEEMVGGLRSFSMYSRISGGEEAESISSLSDFAVLCRTGRQMDLFEEALNNHAVPYQRVGEGSFLEKPEARRILDLLRFLKNPGNSYIRLRLKGISEAALASLSESARAEGDVANFLKWLVKRILPDYQDDPAVSQLIDFAGDYNDDFDGFYRFIDLGSDSDLYRKGSESVALMTMHASKGLEFECVFIPGCEDGLLPCTFFRKDDVDIEEERRLFYVAMTRAKQYLFLTHCGSRFVFGRKHSQVRSPFLDSIEARLIEELEAEVKTKAGKKADRQLKLF